MKRTNINKGCNLLNPYLLTVLLSIPFNKLPWLLELSGTFPVPVRREVELRAPSPPFRAFPDRIFPSTMSLRSPGTSCRPSRDRTRFDRTSMMVSVYPISCRYLQFKIQINKIQKFSRQITMYKISLQNTRFCHLTSFLF